MEQVEGSATSERGGLTSEEKIASLFQPDTLLSDQYFENLRRKTFFEPEKRLMLAVLEDAIRYYQDNWFSRNSKGKGSSTRPRNGSLLRTAIGSLALSMFARRWGSVPHTCAGACSGGSKENKISIIRSPSRSKPSSRAKRAP